MIGKGFQVDLSEDNEELDDRPTASKLGLAGNKGSYGESIISFVKREISSHSEDDEEDDEEEEE